jgi:PPM family protein phosphatase
LDTQIYSSSTKGVREDNQDRILATDSNLWGKSAATLLVADGMGGMQYGDRAAEIARDTVERYSHELFPNLTGGQTELRSSITAMFQEANRQIWEFGQAQELNGSIGTTLVFAIAMGGRYLVANAGDSRCYYVNNWEARQITEDHSSVQEMVRAGGMTTEAAAKSPYRNQLTNALGEPNDIRVDIFPADNYFGVIDEDCILLLCSDGLSGSVSPDEIYQQLHGTSDLESGCDNLISLAYLNGSTDNISVAAVEFGHIVRQGKRSRRLPSVERLMKVQASGRHTRRQILQWGILGLIVVMIIGFCFAFYRNWKKISVRKGK